MSPKSIGEPSRAVKTNNKNNSGHIIRLNSIYENDTFLQFLGPELK